MNIVTILLTSITTNKTQFILSLRYSVIIIIIVVLIEVGGLSFEVLTSLEYITKF